MTARSLAFATAALAALVLAGCSGPPEDDPLAGCLEGDTGTIALGVVNSSGDDLAIEAVELGNASGVETIDRFLVVADDARSATVEFGTQGRAGYGAGDLDATSIAPGDAAFVGVEVALTGTDSGSVDGLVVTSGGRAQAVPVRLELGADCG